jgi:hypothetical protein
MYDFCAIQVAKYFQQLHKFSFQIQDISHQPTKHRVFLEAFKAEDEPDGQNELLSTVLANKRGSEICRS